MVILITDNYCSSNRGDAAILEGIVKSLKKYFPDSEVIVMSEYPESVRLINKLNAVKQKMISFEKAKIKKNVIALYLLICAFFNRKGIELFKFKRIIKKLNLEPYIYSDLVVITGGGFINDFYSPTNWGRLWGMYFAKLLGKSVVIYGQSIGPLEKFFNRIVSKFVLNKIDVITLRDNKSKEILSNIGINRPIIKVTGDAAFAMPVNNYKTLRKNCCDISPELKLNGSDLKISISIREWRHYNDQDGHSKYLKSVAALVDWLIATKKAKVFFASTCTGFGGYHFDDRVVAYQVVDYIEGASWENPSILSGEYTPQELVWFYSKMNLHIGTRMHSNILAILAKTPVFAIAYEFKTNELMRFFGLENYVADINNMDGATLIEKADKALENRYKIKGKIQVKLPQMLERAEKSAEIIFDLFNKKEED